MTQPWVGRRHGALTVVTDIGIRDFGSYQKRVIACLCDCGNRVEILANNLRKQESCKPCGLIRGAAQRATHGLSHSRAWSVHHGMVQRCYNPNVKHYERYGGRGIGVCETWRGPGGFAQFVADMGLPPEGLSLGRKDNDLGYSHSNCRWETSKQQQRNTCRTTQVEISGVVRSVAEWAETSGLPERLVRNRYQSGITGPRLIAAKDLRGETSDQRSRTPQGTFSPSYDIKRN